MNSTRALLGAALAVLACQTGVQAATFTQPSPPVAQSTVVNPGFEGGFAGWSTLGNTNIQTVAFGITPTQGSNQALLVNVGGAVTAASLESFLFGSANGTLTGLGATTGSAITQTFTANAGETLTFSWDFLTNEFLQEPQSNDFAFITLNGAVLATLDTFTPGFITPSAAGFFDSDTGYSTRSFALATTGTYTLGFGVANRFDTLIRSGLLVDNVQVVPEPLSTMGLVFLGGWGAHLRLRRNKAKA
ncbi:hypothetical protein [Anthocerotibacter panamensis]|uniref:hypothetical protein n=1 Tax=Anthocerotibacter panamensis TaxID=2857077 RepID=UPI001C403804|nr:hypothetical protein [Anthocerotibacter panamensis]